VDPKTSPIRLFNQAPEQRGSLDAIRELKNRGFRVAIGHSAATYEQAREAINAGATVITHLFNAMEPLHHRNPGIFGLLGTQSLPPIKKPFFGIIADGIHLHATAINIAWHAHPEGFILITDAMRLLGLPDGVYEWTNGDRIIKKGFVLTLEGTDKIAGSSITLLECLNNFLAWSGVSIAEALGAITSTPARMLGLSDTKGSLEPGADADLVILEDLKDENGATQLKLQQVWKFGQCVYDHSEST
jgi:N-acetylglucosamine-6-phosphate deacetylase